jgi:hypothetical protein
MTTLPESFAKPLQAGKNAAQIVAAVKALKKNHSITETCEIIAAVFYDDHREGDAQSGYALIKAAEDLAHGK